MPTYSANLGFLFTELDLPDAIRAARKAGFAAVECHWPYDTPTDQVNAALSETGLRMLGLNTRRGNVEAGDNGLAAIPGREAEARAAIDEAIDYAAAIGCGAVHVMAGFASGDAAHATFLGNLRYAVERATLHGITVLIEPLNRHDAPGYFLNTSQQAKGIIDEVASDGLKCARSSATSSSRACPTAVNRITARSTTAGCFNGSMRKASHSHLAPNTKRPRPVTIDSTGFN